MSTKKKNKTREKVIVITSVAIVLLLLLLAVRLFACDANIFDSGAQSGQAPYKTREEMQAEVDRIVEEGKFNISIQSVITFDDGGSEGTAYIENVPNNNYDMRVEIVEDATGDVLYKSDIILTNQYVEKIRLEKDLEPGTYDATAVFYALDKNTHKQVSQAAAKIKINVLG